jgi:hypothetical protein
LLTALGRFARFDAAAAFPSTSTAADIDGKRNETDVILRNVSQLLEPPWCRREEFSC